MDSEVAKSFQRILEKQGFTFKLSSKVVSAEASAKSVTFSVEPAAGGEAEKFEADVLLVAVGRTPYTEGLGCETAGIARDARGRIEVDHHYATLESKHAVGFHLYYRTTDRCLSCTFQVRLKARDIRITAI